MYLAAYNDERDLIEAFIRKTQTGSIMVLDCKLHLFVWGAEITIVEQDNSGRLRLIDLMATDEDGHVWLIEAKLGGNSELSPSIWNRQIVPYRVGLAKLDQDTINIRSRRFLSASGKYGHLIATEDYDGLPNAMVRWAKRLGKSAEYGRRLFNNTIKAIKDENVIASILYDRFDGNTWDSRPKDGRAYGYILEKGEGEREMVAIVKEYFQSVNPDIDYFSTAKTWRESSRKAKTIKGRPDNVADYLATPAAEYYHRCLINLRELGWTGRYDSNPKAFAVNMPTYYGAPIRIHLGWIDFASRVPKKYRTAGEYGLKFNIDFRLFKESDNPEIRQKGYHLALSLARSANYTGRGDALGILKYKKDDYVDVDEKTKKGGSWGNWDGETERWINETDRDYVGSSREELDFCTAWDFLRGIIDPEAVAVISTTSK